MTKIHIISGFLGAGKTTLIKKLLKEALIDRKVVLIENEFGEIGIDGEFLKESGIDIKEMNSGCICCSLAGDFSTSLKEVIDTYAPECIVIEPSGVGKLSDVIRAVETVSAKEDVCLEGKTTVVDASKCKLYLKNFGEFFINQVEHASCIILSRTGKVNAKKLEECITILRTYNQEAAIITTPWEALAGTSILTAMEEGDHSLEKQLREEVAHAHECSCGEHHGHEHGHECCCGHHHNHHADEVFTSWGMETAVPYTTEELEQMLKELEQEKTYGMVLRAKGMLPLADGSFAQFDYVPGECEIRQGKPDLTGKICVIGAELQNEQLHLLFHKEG